MAHGTNKRKFVLPSLNDFQRKLEDFYQSVAQPRIKAKQDYEAYVTSIVEYYEKGMTLREIAKATDINLQTISYWVRKKGKPRTQKKSPTEGVASA